MTPEEFETKVKSYFPDALHVHVGGYEGHVKLKLCDASFEGQSLVKRHQRLNAFFVDEIQSGFLHAMALELIAPSEQA